MLLQWTPHVAFSFNSFTSWLLKAVSKLTEKKAKWHSFAPETGGVGHVSQSVPAEIFARAHFRLIAERKKLLTLRTCTYEGHLHPMLKDIANDTIKLMGVRDFSTPSAKVLDVTCICCKFPFLDSQLMWGYLKMGEKERRMQYGLSTFSRHLQLFLTTCKTSS